jgi:NADH-quinone oxidoreductase subunit D
VFLICDGEQVHSARIQAGYAHRGIEQEMMQVRWEQSVPLARQVDPLAPLVGQLAYIQALEMLQQWSIPETTQRLRDAAIALERTANYLWWAARFASLLSATRIQKRVVQLASALTIQTVLLWQQPPEQWMLPQMTAEQAIERSRVPSQARLLKKIASDIASLSTSLERDHWFSLRTRGIGTITTQHLIEKDIQGPVLSASQQGVSDVHGRFLYRLRAASRDLVTVAEGIQASQSGQRNADWNISAGTAYSMVEGPRGPIGLRLTSDGKETPQHVEWHRPSVSFLALLPEWLVGQKLADAELLIASLDLTMMEADG